MKKLSLIIIFTCAVLFADAQCINAENSFFKTKFNGSKDLPILNDAISTYAISLGVDYMEKKNYFLSSSLGYITFGASDHSENVPGEFRDNEERKGFIQLSTSINLYKPLFSENSKVYIGIGPNLNFLIDDNKFDTEIYAGYELPKVNLSAKVEAGISFDLKPVRLDLGFGYLRGLTPAAKASDSDFTLKSEGFMVSLTTGLLL